MIWISTLCLLFLAAWLFFNALNERRWVQAHSHDESVASDEGLLSGFTLSTGSGTAHTEGKISIDQENTRFAKSVAKVQEKTSKLGDKFFESKVAAARVADEADRPRSAREENTLFGRAVARVGEKTERMDQKLDEKMKAASSQSVTSSASEGDSEDLFTRATRKVASKSDEISQRLSNPAGNASQGLGGGRSAPEEEGVFSKMVSKVSAGIEKADAKVQSRIADSRNTSAKSEDLVSRVTSKIGSTISQMDEKIVKTSKDVSSKFNKD